MEATACCFCGRAVDEVTHLVQGPDLFICDIYVDTLATKDHGWRERQIDYLLRLRNRRALAVRNISAAAVTLISSSAHTARFLSPRPNLPVSSYRRAIDEWPFDDGRTAMPSPIWQA
jgi:hypothetical protein